MEKIGEENKSYLSDKAKHDKLSVKTSLTTHSSNRQIDNTIINEDGNEI